MDELTQNRLKELSTRIINITGDYGYMRKFDDKDVLTEFCEDANELARLIKSYLRETL